jgi:hypothetical protein
VRESSSSATAVPQDGRRDPSGYPAVTGRSDPCVARRGGRVTYVPGLGHEEPMVARKSARPPPTGVEMERVAEAAREVIRAIAPELRIEKKWGHPWYVGNDLVVLVGAFSSHVGVEFWRGTTVRDPSHLLQGTGKNLRHVKLRTPREATTPAFVTLVKEAVRLDRSMPPRVR